MCGKEAPVTIDSTVASDASGVGYGLVRVFCGESEVHNPHEGPCSIFLAKRLFTIEERKGSSALREIRALQGAYEEDCLGFRNTSILHLTDSSSVEAVMRIGSPVPELHTAALAIHEACRVNGVRLRVEWRPRKDARMVEADTASRLFDCDDYTCSKNDFKKILDWVGFELNFDLFASSSNAKFPRFAARFAEWGHKEWINAFALDWSSLGEVWACPPPGLVVPVLRQFVRQKATGVLMVPRWRTAKYWPVLAPEGKHFAKMFERFLDRSLVMKVGKDVLSSTFRRKSPFLIFRVNGAVPDPWGESLDFLNCPERGCKRCEA
jgi:hypothetical protein